jgi:hypothetical protein
MKLNYSTTTALNYSQTVYEWTLAGLITEGKIQQVWKKKVNELGTEESVCVLEDVGEAKYAQAFAYAEEKYNDAVGKIEIQTTPGRTGWVQSEILKRCFEINQAMFPIALAEGLLDLKDIAAGIGAGAQNIPSERDRG